MRLSYYIFSLSLFLTLIQCGGDAGPSGQVDMSVTPSSPIVMTSDLVIPVSADSSVTVTAPYLVVNITITNGSSETLNLSGIRFEASYDSTDKNGVTTKIESGTKDIAPSAYDAFSYAYIKTTKTCNSVTTCDQTLFAQLLPGESQTITVSDGTNDQSLKFYLSELPKSDGKNFTYRIKMTALGFFGTYSNITNRLTKSIYFTTY